MTVTTTILHRQYLTIIFRAPEASFYVDGNVTFVPSTTGVTQRFNQVSGHQWKYTGSFTQCPKTGH